MTCKRDGMYLTALEAINATMIGDTTNVLAGAARVIGFPWLSDQSKWYLLRSKLHCFGGAR